MKNYCHWFYPFNPSDLLVNGTVNAARYSKNIHMQPVFLADIDVLWVYSQVAACTWCVLVHNASSSGAGCAVWSGIESVWATTGLDEPLIPKACTYSGKCVCREIFAQ